MSRPLRLVAVSVDCSASQSAALDALIDKPVPLAATAAGAPCPGDRPPAAAAFSFFQARTLPLGVYATDKDFVDHRLHDEALIQRAALAVQRALPLVELMHRARPCLAEGNAAAA
ncbi:Guanine nucleotide exchange factor for Rab-3A [Manis javanica]|nr:Guanine nucleotide exchange factor for Rab-3A [Manis javanica]